MAINSNFNFSHLNGADFHGQKEIEEEWNAAFARAAGMSGMKEKTKLGMSWEKAFKRAAGKPDGWRI